MPLSAQKNSPIFCKVGEDNGKLLLRILTIPSLEIFKQFYELSSNASRACDEAILLPVYPSYSRKSIEKNIETIKKFFGNHNLNL